MPGFLLKTGDITAINDLMNALINLVDIVHLRVSPSGVKIMEEGCRGDLFITIDLQAERFLEFKCDKEYLIAFKPEILHTLLNSHNKRDILVLEYKDTKKTKYDLLVKRYMKDNDCIEECFTMLLLNSEPEVLTAPQLAVDWVLVFKTAIFNSIVTTFSSLENDFIENWVTVTCTNKYIRFEMENGFVMNHVRHTLFTSKPDSTDEMVENSTRRSQKKRRTSDSTNLLENTEFNDNDDEQDYAVCQQYRLKYLNQILKCFSVTKGGVFIYITKDYPIQFEVQVGTIGTLKCTLMFRDDEEENE